MERIKTEWKFIEGFDSYLISNTGRVVNLNFKNTGEIREMKINNLRENGKDYKVVTLTKNGHQKPYLIHRLVAEAFISNPNNYPLINHKDENPSNNVYTNLEWCTSQYNNTYNDIHLRNTRKHVGKKIEQYDLFDNLIATYNSITQASDMTNCCRNSISKCINGKIEQTKGFVFKQFINEK